MRTRNLLGLALVGALLFPAISACSSDDNSSPSSQSQVAPAQPAAPVDPTDGVYAVSFIDSNGYQWCGFYDDYDDACNGLTGLPVEIEYPVTDSDTGWYEILAWAWFLHNTNLFDQSVRPDPSELANQQALFAHPEAYALAHHLLKPAKPATVHKRKVTASPTRPTATASARPYSPAPTTRATLAPQPTRTTVQPLPVPTRTTKPVTVPTKPKPAPTKTKPRN